MLELENNILDKVVEDLLDYLIVYYDEDILKKFQHKIDMLVNNYARKLPGFVKSSEIDDLGNIARMEFIQTLRSWDPISNPVIWPFAYSRINGAMKDHIRYLTKADPSRLYNWITDAAYMYIAINKSSEEFSGKVEDGIMLRQALKQLSAAEQKVVTLKSIHDLTLSDIGKKINLSESQVSRIYSTAILKLRKIITKEK